MTISLREARSPKRRLTLGEELYVIACLEIGMTYAEALAAVEARRG